MTLQRVQGSLRFPMVLADGQMNYAPNVATTSLVDNNSIVACCGYVEWPDGQTRDIEKIRFRTGTISAGTGNTWRCSLQGLQTVDTSGFKPNGTIASSVTSTTFPSSSAASVTGSLSPLVNYAQGDKLAVVFDISVKNNACYLNLGGLSANLASKQINASGMTVSTDSGSTWTINANIVANVMLESSDGTIGKLSGSIPFSTVNVLGAFNSASDPNEYAFTFTPPFAGAIAGVYGLMASSAASNTFTMTLYSNDVAQRTVTIESEQQVATAVRGSDGWLFPTEYVFAAGEALKVGFKCNEASGGITLYAFDCPVAGARTVWPGGTTIGYSTKSNPGGVWTDTTTRRMVAGLLISQLDDGVAASAGGGGRIIRAGC